MENSVLVPGQQLSVAARKLPSAAGARGLRIVVQAPNFQHRSAVPQRAITGETTPVEFELDELSSAGRAPVPMWRFDGQLFIDHWVDPKDSEKLRLFLAIASTAAFVRVHEQKSELVRVSAYFHGGRHAGDVP